MLLNNLRDKLTKFYGEYDVKRSGRPHTETDGFIHIVEEVGELAAQFVNRDHRKDKYSKEEYDDAILDILINTLYLAGISNTDLDKELARILEKDSKKYNLQKPEL